MVTIKEYAKSKNVSYEAVRKQIRRYATELDGHITKVNRTQYLDEYAAEFLDEKRNKSPVIILEASKDEEIEQLKREKEALLIKVASLQEELLKEKDQVKVLQLEKIELLEQKNQEQEQVKQKWWKKFF